MHIDPNLLRKFVAVYEQRSIGRAARVLNLTQPAISKAVQRLEADLDVKLFDRVPLGIVPTAFADNLFRNARRVQAELRSAFMEIQDLKGLGAGEVRVGASPSLLSDLLPRAVNALLTRRPGLEIVILEGSPNEQLAATARGDLDFVVGENPPDFNDGNLESSPLLTDEVRVMCRRQHPLAGKTHIRLRDLVDRKWVLTDQTEVNRRRLFSAFAQARLPPPAGTIRTNSLICLRALLLSNDYLTVVARDIYKLDQEAGLLTVLDVREARWPRSISLTVRRGVSLPPAAQALIAELRAQAERSRFRAPAPPRRAR